MEKQGAGVNSEVDSKAKPSWINAAMVVVAMAASGVVFGAAVGYGLSRWDFRVNLVLSVPAAPEAERQEERIFY